MLLNQQTCPDGIDGDGEDRFEYERDTSIPDDSHSLSQHLPTDDDADDGRL
jgi:hypothetical protein